MHCYPSLAVSISLFPIQPVMMMLMIFNVYKGDDGVYEGGGDADDDVCCTC